LKSRNYSGFDIFPYSRILVRVLFLKFFTITFMLHEFESIDIFQDLHSDSMEIFETERRYYSDSLDTPEPDNVYGMYITEIRNIPKLSNEENVRLSFVMDSGRTFEKAERTLESMRLNDDQSRDAYDRLITGNLRLVINIAKRFLDRGLDFPELINEGNIGLMRGLAKFDPNLGWNVSTYVTYWIRQALFHAVADQGRSVRLPLHRVEKNNYFYIVRDRLMNELGREPTREELANTLGVSTEEIEICVSSGLFLESLDRATEDHDEDDYTIGDGLESDQNVVTESESNIFIKCVRKAWENLPYMEKTVIGLRFELFETDKYTLKEVAQQFDVSGNWIRQIELKAKNDLKVPLESLKYVGAFDEE
jgi:RNA polymerase sigma factor (sigma-70 family)